MTASVTAAEPHSRGPDTAELAISLRGAGKQFGDTWVLRDVDIEVPHGSIVGLIGPSGSGKTTTVRLINGTYSADAGEVLTFGRPPHLLSQRERQQLGYLPQQPVLFDALSVWENLHFHASLNGVRLRRKQQLLEVLELVGLADHRKKLVSETSGGMQRRLALAATLVHAPSLVVLDEPTAGIDPILRSHLWEHFRGLAAEGTTLLVTTQYVGEAGHCDRVGLLAEGALLHFDTPDELRRTACGGEIFTVKTGRPLTDAELEALGDLPEVDAPLERSGAVTTGVVSDAGRAIPAVLTWLGERDIAVVDSEEVTIDYEEMFVRLVEAAQDQEANDE